MDKTNSFSIKKPLTLTFTLLFFLFCIPLIIFPVGSLLAFGLKSLFDISPSLSFLLFSSLKFSLWQATISTLLSALLGVGVAFFLLENGKKERSWIWNLGLLSFSLPSLIVVLALISFWGSEGLHLSIFGWQGILLCHVSMNYPLFMKMVGEYWLSSGKEEEMSALALGATRSQVFRYVTLPKIKPTLLKASLLCFTYCFCSFIPVSLLGADPKYATFELNIYQALKFEGDLSKAAIYACVQFLFLFPLFIAFGKTNLSRNPSAFHRVQIFNLSKMKRLQLGISLGIVLFLLSFGPLLWLVSQSVYHWHLLDGTEVFFALKNSFLLGISCLSIVLPVALAGCYLQRHYPPLHKIVSWMRLFPLFVPVMLLTAVFAFSFPTLIESFRESYWPVATIQAVVLLPLITGILADGFESISKEVERSALSLGANATQVFRSVELPLLFKFVLLSAGIGICFSLSEVSSLLMFGSQQGPTLSLLIFQKLGKYAIKEAGVLASLLVFIMSLILWGAEKCRPS